MVAAVHFRPSTTEAAYIPRPWRLPAAAHPRSADIAHDVGMPLEVIAAYHPGGCLQALNRPLDQADAVVYLHAEVAERLVEGMPVDLDGSYGQRVESNISSS